MNMLKHDHDARPAFHPEQSDFRAHYENLAADTLRSIRRHWWIIASCVVLALALAFGIIPLMPVKYSAEALIYPSLVSNDQGKGVTGGVSLDASSIVSGEARLVNSDSVLRTVVERLGLDKAPQRDTLPPWASEPLDWFRGTFLPETRNYSPFERAVARLRNRVQVERDTRAYFISVSFSANSADDATAVVNAVAVEYLREKALKRAQNAVTAAENELERQRAVYGERHPLFAQAAAALAAARLGMTKAALSPQDSGWEATATDDVVELAIPNRTPTSPKGMVIMGLAAMLGLVAGIGLVIRRDRRRREPPAVVALPNTIETDPTHPSNAPKVVAGITAASGTRKPSRHERGRGKYS